MTHLALTLTEEENKWLDDWSVMQAYSSPEEGIKEVLRVCGAIPRGHEYWKDKFSFSED